MTVVSNYEHGIPDASDQIDRLRAVRARTGHLFVGLDFDGTLAPLVTQPGDAQLAPGAAGVLERLDSRDDTTLAIITGRSVADVRRRLGMPHIHFAGNHGLEIEGPGHVWLHPEAESSREPMAALLARLRDVFADREDVTLEDKVVSFSVHFRAVEDTAEQTKVIEAVHAAAAALHGTRRNDDTYGTLKLAGGRRVVEVRPAIAWDKGRALLSLRDRLRLESAPTIFIGDDMTDEDAFRELTGKDDLGIVVGRSRLAETRARAMLPSIDDVIAFLAELAA